MTLTDFKMALTFLYSGGCNHYFALIQFSTIFYWDVLKSSVNYCLSQIAFQSYYFSFNQLYISSCTARFLACTSNVWIQY